MTADLMFTEYTSKHYEVIFHCEITPCVITIQLSVTSNYNSQIMNE